MVEMRACSDAARCLPHLGPALPFQTMLEALGLGKVGLKTQLAVDLYCQSCASHKEGSATCIYARTQIGWHSKPYIPGRSF